MTSLCEIVREHVYLNNFSSKHIQMILTTFHKMHFQKSCLKLPTNPRKLVFGKSHHNLYRRAPLHKLLNLCPLGPKRSHPEVTVLNGRESPLQMQHTFKCYAC